MITITMKNNSDTILKEARATRMIAATRKIDSWKKTYETKEKKYIYTITSKKSTK